MKKTVGAVLLGLVTWIVVASLGNRLLRAGLAGYVAAEPAMAFTHAMMAARLVLGAVSSLCAGFAAAWLYRRSATAGRTGVTALAVVLLVVFVPLHVALWAKFPPWYHLTFLASLPLLTMLGGRLAPRPA
jgi:hypothetical protein